MHAPKQRRTKKPNWVLFKVPSTAQGHLTAVRSIYIYILLHRHGNFTAHYSVFILYHYLRMAASKDSELDKQKTDTDTSRRQILRQTELTAQEKRTETV